MLYMLLINYDPSLPFDGEILQPKHAELEAELREQGLFVSGAGLFPVEQPGSHRVQGGNAMKIDGPFAEAKEVLGGYYLVDCTEEQAIEIAGRIPVESRGWIDIRPVALFHPNVEKISGA